MKVALRLPAQRSVTFIIAVYLVVVLLVLLWALQLLGTVTEDDPARTPTLLMLSLLFPAALVAISTVSIIRVVSQHRAGVPGSRLRLRLIGSFALTVAVTAIPVVLLSALFLRTAIGLWLAPDNGAALRAGERLASTMHDELRDRLRDFGESAYLDALVESDDRDAGDLWRAVRDAAPWIGALQVAGGDRELSMGDPDFFRPAEEWSRDGSAGSLPRRIVGETTVLSWAVDAGPRRLLLSAALPEAFDAEVARIAKAADEWRRYDRLSRTVGGVLAFFGLFLSGPLILMALLIGIALSDRVMRPLVALGEATRKITEGDFSFRVLSPKEDELAFLTQSFNRMIRELEVSRTKIVQTEKVAAWQVIAQRLAHELRNPLTPIKLSAQRVRKKALDDVLDRDTASKCMDLILREVDGLDKLLQDFREFAGAGPPQTSRLSLRDHLEEALERFRSVHHEVRWQSIDGNDDPEVMADALQIRQVLVNLLTNAMESGAGTVSGRIDLVYRGTTPYARLQIRDDGEGIAADRATSVFQPYDSTRDRGSGLGLAVVQRIITDHRGRIWFESELGTGTVFYIDLPAVEGT